MILIDKILANGCLVNESRSNELPEDLDLNRAVNTSGPAVMMVCSADLDIAWWGQPGRVLGI